MNKFKWLLNWSLSNITVRDGDILPVYFAGRMIGQVQISLVKDQIIGTFDLVEHINENDYILYMISVPDQGSNFSVLSGINIVPKEQLGDNVSRFVKDMTLL